MNRLDEPLHDRPCGQRPRSFAGRAGPDLSADPIADKWPLPLRALFLIGAAAACWAVLIVGGMQLLG
jgi:hypothetical protein